MREIRLAAVARRPGRPSVRPFLSPRDRRVPQPGPARHRLAGGPGRSRRPAAAGGPFGRGSGPARGARHPAAGRGAELGLCGLPPAGRLARAGGPREAGVVRRGELLGPADRQLGRPGAGDPDRRSGPAAHGGNRTGRIFTGDRSGDWLFASLHRVGLASQPTSVHAGDGQRLTGARMVAAVKCAPPQNLPTPEERDTCAPWLERELRLLLPGLGRWSASAASAGTPRCAPWPPPACRSRDRGRSSGTRSRWSSPSDLTLLGCYHPSQQNTFTGRLTEPMIDAVLGRAAELGPPMIGAAPVSQRQRKRS